MNDDTYLISIGDEEEEVYKWSYVGNIKHEFRIYYKLNEGERNGFYFYALFLTSGTMNDAWEPYETTVRCLFNGVAYGGGLRHMFTGDDQSQEGGYFFYPDLVGVSEMMLAIRKLELAHSADVMFPPDRKESIDVILADLENG